MSEEKLWKQGAEARLYISTYNQIPCIIKERFVKKYRHPELDDSLTKERMKAEAKTAERCEAAGLRVPRIFKSDFNTRRIYMEYFPKSETVKDYVDKLAPFVAENLEILKKIEILSSRMGSIIGTMHSNNIIHGDLTTSNFLLNPKDFDNDVGSEDYELIIIDFGLSYHSQSVEDKGVDLYVLERVLLSTHTQIPAMFAIAMEAYKKTNEKSCKEVLERFEAVRARGRKRTMIG